MLEDKARAVGPRLTALVGLSALGGCVLITDEEWDYRTQPEGGTEEPCELDIWYSDADGDGFGDPRGSVQGCDQPTGTVDNFDDCDDTNPEVNVLETWYRDEDGDGYGSDQSVYQCNQPPRYVLVSGDCDDTDPDINPEGREVCNLEDDDCNGEVDDEALDAQTWYVDTDSDGYGSPLDPRVSCEAPTGYVDNADDCLDTVAVVNPGAAEVCGDGFDNDCDSDPTDCRLDGEESLFSVASQWTGPSGAAAGTRLAVGDVTQDGALDALISAPDYNGSGNFTGRIYVLSGPVSGGLDLEEAVSTGAAVAIDGATPGDRIGRSLAVTDLNSDGAAEFAVGTHFATPGTQFEGTVWFFDGPVTAGGTITDLASGSISGATAGDRAGIAFSAAGPGQAIIGAIGANSFAGAAYLVTGPVTAAQTTSDLVAIQGNAGDRLGSAVFGGNDLTGDGVPDLVVGAPQAEGEPPPFDVGETYVMAGPVTASGLADDLAAVSFLGRSNSEGSGGAFAAGDLDGDGVDDLVIGVDPRSGYAGEGAAWVVRGGTDLTGGGGSDSGGSDTGGTGSGSQRSLAAVPVQLLGSAVGDDFGASLVVDDFDGDGAVDLLVGAPGSATGGAHLFYGPVTASALATIDNRYTGTGASATGTALASGDLNNDGFVDLLFGAPEALPEGVLFTLGTGL